MITHSGTHPASSCRLVTYADLAQWEGISLAEAERRFGGRLDGPERMRIAGEDCFWEHDVERLLQK